MTSPAPPPDTHRPPTVQVWGAFGLDQAPFYQSLHNGSAGNGSGVILPRQRQPVFCCGCVGVCFVWQTMTPLPTRRCGCPSPTSPLTGITIAPTTGACLRVGVGPSFHACVCVCVRARRFAQLAGHKRILLAPPTVHAAMQLYPSIHPSYHQSQWEPAEYGPMQAGAVPPQPPMATALAASYAVVLGPGDVLYIPRESPRHRATVCLHLPAVWPPHVTPAAYWFHTVTALNMSMSLSVVSPSEEEMVFAKVHPRWC